LNARNLVKERRYLRAAGELLARHGATAETAALAAGIAAACYLTAQVATAANPARLPDGVGRPQPHHGNRYPTRPANPTWGILARLRIAF
jgi:hypothetical protein